MPIPAASGYPQLSGSLINPLFAMELLERWYCSTIYSDISSTEYTGDLSKHGDQITFWREPKPIVRRYDKNDKILHDTLDGEPVTMTVDHAYNFSIKMNHIDEQQLQNFDAWKEAFLRNAGKELALVIDPILMTEMYTSASDDNEGATAGVLSNNINMGQPNAPLVVTKTNIVEIFSQVHQVLDEQCAPKDGRFILVPPAGMTALRNSDLRAAYLTGLNWSPIVNGRIPDTVMGFNVMESRYIPSEIDPGTLKLVYHMVAGVKSATAFAATIENTRIMSDVDDWANYYQGLSVFGFKVLYPDGLVHMYVTFDATP